ncbi:peptidoglycan-binding domain-containing protein [Rivularia sp. UHCC 0363]|uniref:peptidoglycan-binding domain-containing protein n=1 Tax=Rivularia sp. UHCC 0363 TaxID=3110244 RepID=UPI002B1F796B|nr:peptidoglycan-binding domain-containing protein [Rivularia sp. UHCC 0363]MEA5595440.1 peptidoglycan-binding domain-containing protein [Rivularia sp. UHCC 0363]
MNSLPVIQRNQKGEAVRFLQQLLLGYGFDQVEFQSEFDERTENAVRNFQEQRNLSPDGIVDVNTWNALIEGTSSVCNAARE